THGRSLRFVTGRRARLGTRWSVMELVPYRPCCPFSARDRWDVRTTTPQVTRQPRHGSKRPPLPSLLACRDRAAVPSGGAVSRPPLPPFTQETAVQKVQAAENAWNTRDPERVAL